MLPYIVGFFLILGILTPLIEILIDALSGGHDDGSHGNHSEIESDEE